MKLYNFFFKKGASDNEVTSLKLQASQAISRLEESLEKGTDSEGSTWNNPSGFLSHPKSPEDVFSLIQVISEFIYSVKCLFALN